MAKEPAPSPLSNVDQSLLRAARVWGSGDVGAIWERFPADRRSSLRWGWEIREEEGDTTAALDRLCREHSAQARPDLSRVHASWLVRSMRNEPPSVRRAVAAGLPASTSESLREGLGLTPGDLTPDRPAHPAALEVARSLWTDRFVGDLPEREDDPPVIAALSRFDSPTITRLLQTTGLAKWAITDRPLPDLDRRERERVAPLQSTLAGIDARFVQVASRDVEATGPITPRSTFQVGMASFARLLLAADPYRVGWALQHIPYPTARWLRSLMGPGGRKAPMLMRWEAEVLRAAWTRLHEEGRISVPWGDAP